MLMSLPLDWNLLQVGELNLSINTIHVHQMRHQWSNEWTYCILINHWVKHVKCSDEALPVFYSGPVVSSAPLWEGPVVH